MTIESGGVTMHKNNNTLLHMFIDTCKRHAEKTAVVYRVGDEEFEVSYKKLFDDVLVLSREFRKKGISGGDKVTFVCDNRYEWLVTDLSIASIGAVSIPRGSDATEKELAYIFEHSESTFLVLENEKMLERYKEVISSLSPLKALFVIESTGVHKVFDHTFAYHDLIRDRNIYDNDMEEFLALGDDLDEDDLLTIMYTSGTTGTPKGVMLTHKNIMKNIEVLPEILDLSEEDLWVSILPSWHSFERTVEYLIISAGCTMVYSSVRTFADDLQKYKPTIVATVPRLWESMYTKINTTLEKQDPKKAKMFKKLVSVSAAYKYNKRIIDDELPVYAKQSFLGRILPVVSAYIKLLFLYPLNAFAQKKLQAVQKKFGGRLRLAVSGGGSLPEFLDKWIDAIGIRIVNAYGMTECAPAIAGRALNCNTFGTLGLPVRDTQLKILGSDGSELGCGEAGEIAVKGDQVMPGYYKNDEENAKVFTKDGYFLTGDLGRLTCKGELVITGRSKEVIVLANGENVDPSKIESAVASLPFIQDMMLVGQDKKGLGLLIVPDFEHLKECVGEKYGKAVDSIDHILEDQQLLNKIKGEINSVLQHTKDFKPFEKLQSITFLKEEFKLGDELTNTYKKKRRVIEAKYKALIDRILP
jgi:long-chain acyl-CoA synthetase